MILYSDTVGNFIDNCSGINPAIGSILLSGFKANHIGGGSTSEYNSWIHSLPKVAEALKDNSIPKNAGVGVEYKLVDTKQRVDFLIFGKDEEDKENIILVNPICQTEKLIYQIIIKILFGTKNGDYMRQEI